jgi:hypothetical protein
VLFEAAKRPQQNADQFDQIALRNTGVAIADLKDSRFSTLASLSGK